MQKGKLTPEKTAKQRKRRRAYERERNILRNRPKSREVRKPVKATQSYQVKPAQAKKLSLWQRIKNLWYNRIKKNRYVKGK